MKTLKGVVVLVTLGAAMLIPAAALAGEAAPVLVQENGSAPLAKTKPTPESENVECKTIAGNPELEQLAKHTTPPPPPPGEVEAPSNQPTASCPAGTLRVTKPGKLVNKGARPFVPAQGSARKEREMQEDGLLQGENFTTGEPNAGFFHAGVVYEAAAKVKWVGLVMNVQQSETTIPVGSRTEPEAHTAGQLLLRGGGKGQYTIEMGWVREPEDQKTNHLGVREFYQVNPDDYGPKTCTDCGITLNEGIANPFGSPGGQYWAASDGTPNSACRRPPTYETVEAPCTAYIANEVEQYKGAWWIWFGAKWIGRISDINWGNHFKFGTEASVFGEVFNYPNNPGGVLMGNGNKGGCACATAALAPSIAPKPAAKEEIKFTRKKVPTAKCPSLKSECVDEDWPQKFTVGTVDAKRESFHFGG